MQGYRRVKERLTLGLFANMDGSEKRKPVIIGKAAEPNCMKRVYKQSMRSLPVEYYWSKSGWINVDIWEKIMEKLNEELKRRERKIVLFVDNCSAHYPMELEQIELVYLPANTTSHLQPLDQGILRSVKCKYKRVLVQRLCAALRAGKNPKQAQQSMDFKIACDTIAKCWNETSAQLIRNCFRKATFCTKPPEEIDDEDDVPEDVWAHVREKMEYDFGFDELLDADKNEKTSQKMTPAEILEFVKGPMEVGAEVEVGQTEEDNPHEPNEPTCTLMDCCEYFTKIRTYFQRNSIHTGQLDLAEGTLMRHSVGSHRKQTSLKRFLSKTPEKKKPEEEAEQDTDPDRTLVAEEAEEEVDLSTQFDDLPFEERSNSQVSATSFDLLTPPDDMLTPPDASATTKELQIPPLPALPSSQDSTNSTFLDLNQPIAEISCPLESVRMERDDLGGTTLTFPIGEKHNARFPLSQEGPDVHIIDNSVMRFSGRNGQPLISPETPPSKGVITLADYETGEGSGLEKGQQEATAPHEDDDDMSESEAMKEPPPPKRVLQSDKGKTVIPKAATSSQVKGSARKQLSLNTLKEEKKKVSADEAFAKLSQDTDSEMSELVKKATSCSVGSSDTCPSAAVSGPQKKKDDDLSSVSGEMGHHDGRLQDFGEFEEQSMQQISTQDDEKFINQFLAPQRRKKRQAEQHQKTMLQYREKKMQQAKKKVLSVQTLAQAGKVPGPKLLCKKTVTKKAVEGAKDTAEADKSGTKRKVDAPYKPPGKRTKNEDPESSKSGGGIKKFYKARPEEKNAPVAAGKKATSKTATKATAKGTVKKTGVKKEEEEKKTSPATKRKAPPKQKK